MKFLYWNIRGVGNSDSRSELSSLCHQHHPDFVCIAEPMVSMASIPSSFWASLNLQLITVNDRGNLLPNIWLFCSMNITSSSVISISDQHITFQAIMEGTLTQFTCIYAATTIAKRKSLWLELLTLRQTTTIP